MFLGVSRRRFLSNPGKSSLFHEGVSTSLDLVTKFIPLGEYGANCLFVNCFEEAERQFPLHPLLVVPKRHLFEKSRYVAVPPHRDSPNRSRVYATYFFSDSILDL